MKVFESSKYDCRIALKKMWPFEINIDFWNFAKVIIARSSKDKNTLAWWENQQNNEASSQIAFNQNCRNSNDLRYNIYNQIKYRFPQMHVSPSIFYKRLPHIQKYVTIKILPEQQQEWWTQTICWFFSPSKLVKADKNCQTEPQLNQLQSMHLWLTNHVFTAFVIHKRTADCNWQMSGNDRKFLNHNKSNHIIRGNKYHKNNGEYNQSHIWEKNRAKFHFSYFPKFKLNTKIII